MKHTKQLEEARAGSQAAVKELEQLQNEKRKMLMEHETSKLKELDESYAKEFKDWKADLKPRKQVGGQTFNYQQHCSQFVFLTILAFISNSICPNCPVSLMSHV